MAGQQALVADGVQTHVEEDHPEGSQPESQGEVAAGDVGPADVFDEEAADSQDTSEYEIADHRERFEQDIRAYANHTRDRQASTITLSPGEHPEPNGLRLPRNGKSTVPTYPSSRHELVSECERCPALVASRERIVWGTGPADANVLVVGEAPAYGTPEADRWRGGNWTGMAYTSRHSGRRIRALFEDLGYPDAYYTNAVKCFPATTESPQPDAQARPTNREPTPEERERCCDHLLTEIETVDPTVVVTTGKHATATVLEAEGQALESFLETVLEPIQCADLGVTVLALLHPSYQDVWVARLGYDADGYRKAIGKRLDELCGRH